MIKQEINKSLTSPKSEFLKVGSFDFHFLPKWLQLLNIALDAFGQHKCDTSIFCCKYVYLHDRQNIQLPFFRVPHSTSDEMNEAVASAKAAFKTWSKTTPLARQQILFKSVDVLTAHLLLPLSLPEPGVKLFFFRCIASPYK